MSITCNAAMDGTSDKDYACTSLNTPDSVSECSAACFAMDGHLDTHARDSVSECSAACFAMCSTGVCVAMDGRPVSPIGGRPVSPIGGRPVSPIDEQVSAFEKGIQDFQKRIQGFQERAGTYSTLLKKFTTDVEKYAKIAEEAFKEATDADHTKVLSRIEETIQIAGHIDDLWRDWRQNDIVLGHAVQLDNNVQGLRSELEKQFVKIEEAGRREDLQEKIAPMIEGLISAGEGVERTVHDIFALEGRALAAVEQTKLVRRNATALKNKISREEGQTRETLKKAQREAEETLKEQLRDAEDAKRREEAVRRAKEEAEKKAEELQEARETKRREKEAKDAEEARLETKRREEELRRRHQRGTFDPDALSFSSTQVSSVSEMSELSTSADFSVTTLEELKAWIESAHTNELLTEDDKNKINKDIEKLKEVQGEFGTQPTDDETMQAATREATREAIKTIIRDKIVPKLNIRPLYDANGAYREEIVNAILSL